MPAKAKTTKNRKTALINKLDTKSAVKKTAVKKVAAKKPVAKKAAK